MPTNKIRKKSLRGLKPIDRLKRQLQRSAQSRESNAVASNAIAMMVNCQPMRCPSNQHKIDLTFDPLDILLDQIAASGEIDVINNGTAVLYHEGDQCWYPMVAAFVSMSDVFTKLCVRFGWEDKTHGIRLLAKKIDVQMPLFQADVDAAKTCIAWMRAVIQDVTPNQFSEESVEIQIRDEIQAHKNPTAMTVST